MSIPVSYNLERSGNRHRPAILLICGLLLLIAAGYAGVKEISSYIYGSGTIRAKVEDYSMGNVDPGISIQSQTAYLLDCDLVMNSIVGRAQPTESRIRTLAACLAGATNIAKASPSFALAWVISATALAYKADWERFKVVLRYAYRSARSEQWLAKMRVGLAERHLQHYDEQLLQLHQNDLALLLSTPDGRAFLAPRYKTWEAAREQIDLILNDVPETWRDRFLRAVDRL